MTYNSYIVNNRKKVEFDSRSSEDSTRFKNIIYEKPFSDKVEHSKLGIYATTFNVSVQVYSEAESNSLKDILNISSQQYLSSKIYLPKLGIIEVVVNSFTRSIDHYKSVGLYLFKIEFTKVRPSVARDSISEIDYDAKKEALIGNVEDAVIENTEDTVKGKVVEIAEKEWVKPSTAYSFKKLTSLVKKFSYKMNSITSKITNYSDDLSELTDSVGKVATDAETLINSPIVLFEKVQTIFSKIGKFDDKIQDVFDSVVGLYDYTLDKLGVNNDEVLSNTDLLNNAITSVALGTGMDLCLKISYTSQEEIKANTDKINIGFNNAINTISDKEVLNGLIGVKTQFDLLIKNLEISLPKVIEIEINSTPLTVLCYLLYGKLIYQDQIISLNNLTDTSRVKGKIKILSYGTS